MSWHDLWYWVPTREELAEDTFVRDLRARGGWGSHIKLSQRGGLFCLRELGMYLMLNLSPSQDEYTDAARQALDAVADGHFDQPIHLTISRTIPALQLVDRFGLRDYANLAKFKKEAV